MLLVGLLLFFGRGAFGWTDFRIVAFDETIRHPDLSAVISGIPYGVVAFFSVFIFMFKGRTATFAGLVNRLTSLVAGTGATILTALLFKLKFPSAQDWVSLLFILVAVYFLSRAEQKRVVELRRTAEIPAVGPGVVPAPAGAGR